MGLVSDAKRPRRPLEAGTQEPASPPPEERSLDGSASNLFVLTGTSRGIGQALAELLLDPSNAVVCITRTPSDALAERAVAVSARLEQWSQDLGYPLQAATRLESWLQTQSAHAFQAATLINNAAVITPPGPIDEVDPAEIVNTLRVSLESPMLLTAAFLRATRDWACARKVLNVSSSLGRRAMAGLSSYCAVKAGMDHYSRVVALDEALKRNGARIVSLAPGSVDTDLQARLRAADRAKFPDGARFEQMKREGRLPSSTEAAAKVLEFLRREDFGISPVADVLDAPASRLHL